MPTPTLRVYFDNPVGRILEHPDGFALVQYREGPRELFYLQAFLRHAGQLLKLRGWHKMLGDQRQMSPFTEEESQWIVNYWLSFDNQGRNVYGAVLLLPSDFSQLSDNNVALEGQAATMTYHLFSSEEAAVEWLLHRP